MCTVLDGLCVRSLSLRTYPSCRTESRPLGVGKENAVDSRSNASANTGGITRSDRMPRGLPAAALQCVLSTRDSAQECTRIALDVEIHIYSRLLQELFPPRELSNFAGEQLSDVVRRLERATGARRLWGLGRLKLCAELGEAFPSTYSDRLQTMQLGRSRVLGFAVVAFLANVQAPSARADGSGW